MAKRKGETFMTGATRGKGNFNDQVVGEKKPGWGTKNMAFEGGPMPEGVEAPATGTSIFDPVLCELAYRWLCPPGGLVLDPFAGGSVRGIVASKLGRRYLGVDLRAEQIAANELQAERICGPEDPRPHWVVDEASHFLSGGQGDGLLAADFIFSCPPYADLEVYSDDPRDLSVMPHAKFREAFKEIVALACDHLLDDRFACFVMGDARGADGFYYGLPSLTIEAFAEAGLRLYNEAILVTAIGSLPVRARKQFEASRKLGKTHQNVLIFCKGDPKRATAAIGKVEFGALDSESPAAAEGAAAGAGGPGVPSSPDHPASQFGEIL